MDRPGVLNPQSAIRIPKSFSLHYSMLSFTTSLMASKLQQQTALSLLPGCLQVLIRIYKNFFIDPIIKRENGNDGYD
jgi:hypothetical protein